MKSRASRPRPGSKLSCRTARRSPSHARRRAALSSTAPGCIPLLRVGPYFPPAGVSQGDRLDLQGRESHRLRRPGIPTPHPSPPSGEGGARGRRNVIPHTGAMSDLSSSGHAIETLQVEERRYRPDPAFSKQANAQPDIYGKGFDDFWTAESKRITFFEPWTKLYEWKPPYAKWFLGGKLNVCFNCVDRHVEGGLRDKVAYFWEGEPEDDRREITFGQLQKDVVRFANALKKLGVKRGTHVVIYMGMIPELPVAMLACTRIGAPFTVVFGGFSGESLSGRLNDMQCELLITQDEGWRRGNKVPLKANADAALDASPTVKRCVVFKRTGGDVPMLQGRDVWAHDVQKDVTDDTKTCPCEPMESEDLLYLLYTSGTTAKPKGIIHTTAG